MRKVHSLRLVAVIRSGCSVHYRQPVFQGSLLEQANVVITRGVGFGRCGEG